MTDLVRITTTESLELATSGANKRLNADQLYRMRVRSYNVETQDVSDWTDPIFVYPSDDPPRARSGTVRDIGFTVPFIGFDVNVFSIRVSRPPKIADTPLYGYQRGRAWSFTLCDVPTGITVSRSKIADAAKTWGRIERDSAGNSLIRVTERPLPGDASTARACVPPFGAGPILSGRDEIIFTTEYAMKLVGCSRAGCWRSRTWEYVGLQAWTEGIHGAGVRSLHEIDPGTVLIREIRPATGTEAGWNRPGGMGCSVLESLVVHEVGHAFGIGWPDPTEIRNRDRFLNLHPEHSADSIMSYKDPNKYCEPQAYDIAAIKANYQSR